MYIYCEWPKGSFSPHEPLTLLWGIVKKKCEIFKISSRSLCVLVGWGMRERAGDMILYDIGREKTTCHDFGSCPFFNLKKFPIKRVLQGGEIFQVSN